MRQAATALDIYTRQMSEHEVLHIDEELKLARRYKKGDKAAGDKLVTANLRFALKVAHEYRSWGLPLEDLVQEANVGLVKALQKYNADRGYRFITYAVWWIRACIINYLMHNVSVVRFGTTTLQRSLFLKIGAIVGRLQQEHPGATNDELFAFAADELSTTAEQIEEIYVRTHRKDQSLNVPIAWPLHSSSGGSTFEDLVEDPAPLLDDQVDQAQEVERIRSVVRACVKNRREQLLVDLRLLAENPLTLAELGSHWAFGGPVSRERTRQIEKVFLTRVAYALGR